MVQGESHEKYENVKDLPFNPKNIKFVLLTHAHLDHCGLLPRLYKEGFVGKVYCTYATARLANEILLDSAKQSSYLYSKRDVSRIEFEPIDRRFNFKWAKPIPLDKDLFIYLQRSAHILGSASIGLVWYKDGDEKNDILFTGDIGNNTESNPFQPLLKYRQKPYQTLRNIVIESTYGNRLHDSHELSFENRIELLERHINTTLAENQGQLIIPTFSMHRTQEILFDLYYLFKIKWKNNPIKVWQIPRPMLNGAEYDEYLSNIEGVDPETLDSLYIKKNDKEYRLNPDFKDIKVKAVIPVQVICDSALGKNISRVYADELCRKEYSQKDNVYKYPYRNHKMNDWLSMDDASIDEELQQLYNNDRMQIGMHLIKYQDTEVMTQRPRIIITSSGMCDKGPVLGHLKRTLQDKKNTILLTGYQAPGTNGHTLSQLSHISKEESDKCVINLGDMKLKGKEVQAKIEKIGGYFGHADQKSILEYLFTDDNERTYTVPNIFLNHGNNDAREILKDKIESFCELKNAEKGNPDCFQTHVELPLLSNGFYDLDSHEWVKEMSFEEQVMMRFEQMEKQLADLHRLAT
jgi:metallo-beta-lactamase family protein